MLITSSIFKAAGAYEDDASTRYTKKGLHLDELISTFQNQSRGLLCMRVAEPDDD
jgi:hypothetical protein